MKTIDTSSYGKLITILTLSAPLTALAANGHRG